jgi:TM2 domain-containing membrane protein YozV
MPKSRLAYILLALFLGCFGVHNFFAGYTGRGLTQLLLTLLSFGLLSLVIWVWAIIEICTVTKDARGVDFVS